MSTRFHSAVPIAILLSNLPWRLPADGVGGWRRTFTAPAVLSRCTAQLCGASRWFPGLDIRPLPAADGLDAALATYGVIVQMHEDRPFRAPGAADGRFSCFDRWRVAAGIAGGGRGESLTLLGELARYADDVSRLRGLERP